MTTPSFIIGNRNWAIKEGSLLGYAFAPTSSQFVPRFITSSRASDSWVVNSSGSYTRVPWNLVSYSQDYTNALWTKVAATVTASVTTAPDGTNTATQLVISPGSGQHYIAQSRTFAVSSSYTFSTYAKKGTNNFLQITAPNAGFGVNAWGNFDLQNGIIGTTGSSATCSIEDAGNGWYRCFMTAPAIAVMSGNFFLAGITSATDGRIPIITGTGEFIYIWGSQINETRNKFSYFPTTTRSNVQGIDYYNITSGSIFLEKQATNQLLYSTLIESSSWTKYNLTVVPNTTGTLSPFNDSTAVALVENSVNDVHGIETATSRGIATYNFSIYAKKAARDIICVTPSGYSGFVGGQPYVFYNLTNGTIVSAGLGTTGSIINVGDGWYRCDFTATSTSNTAMAMNYFACAETSSVTYAGVNGQTALYVWGPQMEVNNYASPYIPTVNTAITRLADTPININLTQYNSTNIGSLYIHWLADKSPIKGFKDIGFYSGSISSNSLIFETGSGQLGNYSSSLNQFGYNWGFSSNQEQKIVLTYSGSDIRLYLNGSEVFNTQVNTLPAYTNFVYDANRRAAQIAYYPIRLTNSQSIQLTTL